MTIDTRGEFFSPDPVPGHIVRRRVRASLPLPGPGCLPLGRELDVPRGYQGVRAAAVAAEQAGDEVPPPPPDDRLDFA